MARCDTCHLARWTPGYVTSVWCRKKKKYIRLGGGRHLLAAAEDIRRRASGDVIKT